MGCFAMGNSTVFIFSCLKREYFASSSAQMFSLIVDFGFGARSFSSLILLHENFVRYEGRLEVEILH